MSEEQDPEKLYAGDELLAQALIGVDCEKFKASNVFRYLEGCARMEAEAATDALKYVDPEDSKTIRTLQNEIWRHEQFITWLNEAISDGNVATSQLSIEDGEDD